MFKKLTYIFILAFAIFGFSQIASAFGSQATYPVRLFVFHSDDCSHCKDELAFIESIFSKYPTLELHKFEVSSFKNYSIFSKVAERYSLSGGVPTTVIGDEVFVGFSEQTGESLEQNIQYCQESACPSWLDDLAGLDPIVSGVNAVPDPDPEPQPIDQQGTEDKPEADQSSLQRNSVQVFGKTIEFDQQTSVGLMGVVLGLADGINPCMFSVLIFLLTYLLAIGSRKRAVKAGIVFAVTTFVVYFLLMLGLIKVIDVLRIEKYARWFIIIVAFLAGIIMIKDYFFYGKWFSLEIPKRFRPTIQMLIKKGTIPSAIVLALFSSIVELPCTSVLPLAYVNVLATRDLAPFWYLILYNLFFIVPLLVIIFGVAFAWAKVEALESFRLKFRKYMKLGAGILLILLAIAFWQNWL